MRHAAGAWLAETPVTNLGGRAGRVRGSLAVVHPCRFVYFVEWNDAPGSMCAVAGDGRRAQIARLVPYVSRMARPSHPRALHKAASVPGVLQVRAKQIAHDFDGERRDGDPRARRR